MKCFPAAQDEFTCPKVRDHIVIGSHSGIHQRVIAEMVCDKKKYLKPSSLAQLLAATSGRGNSGFRTSNKISFVIVKSRSGTPLVKN